MTDTIRIDIPPGYAVATVGAVATEDIRAGDYLALDVQPMYGIFAALFRPGEHPRPWYVAEHDARVGEQVRALILREG